MEHADVLVDAVTASRLNTVVAHGLMILLIFGVLAFAAVEDWSICVMRCGAAVLLLLWAAGHAGHSQSRVAGAPLFTPMVLWAIVMLGQYLSGHTAYRYATFFEAMNFAAYGIVTFLAVQCFQSEKMRKLLALATSVSGVVVACFAMVQDATSQGRLYWLRMPRNGGSIYGPYVNHNHYAGLMEMLIPIPLVLCLGRTVAGSRKLFYGVAALLMSASLFLSGSRGGVISFLAELCFSSVLLSAAERKSRQAVWRRMLLLCGLLLALLCCLGTRQVWTRIADLCHAYNNEVSGGRWTIDRDSLRMWAQRPLSGWGLGTFPVVYPQFRSFHSDLVTNQAHNDILQIGVETGIAGFAIMLVFVALLYRHALRNAVLDKSTGAAVAMGAIIGCTGLLVHSFVDFNLHIPANAALFFFLCGIAVGGPRIPATSAISESR